MSVHFIGNIIPELERCGRVIAPDLIGQGDSEKLPASDGAERYSFEVAFEYLDGLLHEIGADNNVTLVIHDWGSGLGFHWARLYPESVKGIAYMEAIVMPMSWDDWPESAQGIFQGFRSPKGEELVLERKYTSWSLENVAVPSVVACVRELASAHPARVAYVVLDAADNGVSSNRVRLIASTPEVIRALKEMPVRRVSVADAFAAAGLPLPADFIKSNTSNRDGTPCVRSVTARPRQPPRALDAPTLCARPYGAGAAVELHGHSEPPTHMEHARRHHRALSHCRRKRRPHGLSARLAAAAGLARRTARRRQRRGRRLSKRPSSGRQHRGWLEARARVRARCRAGPILPPHPRPGTAAAGPRRDGRRRARPRARAGRARAGRAPGGRRRPRRPPRAPAQAPPPHGARGRPRGRGGPGAGPRGHARESQVPRRGEPPWPRSRLARPRRVQRSLSIYYYSMYYYLLSYLYIQEFSSVLGFDFLPQMSKWLYGRKGKPPTDF